jgi:hypothetical protein
MNVCCVNKQIVNVNCKERDGTMKKLMLTLLVAVAVATTASAVPTCTVDRVGAVYSAPVGGGELRVVPNADLIAISGENGPFYTFCLEIYEDVDETGATVYDAAILTEAVLGNGRRPGEAAGPLGGDPLDPETAFLYSEYRKGNIAVTNAAEAAAMQSAIWFLEAEITQLNLLPPEAQALVTYAQNNAPNTIGNVRVLNLSTDNNKVPAQDLLITVIPTPGAMVLGGIGAALVGFLRRRKKL